MSIILMPFAKLLLFFYSITGSYGVSLLLFCLVIRIILFPFFLKGRKSMLSMSGLTEKQKALQQKYPRDRQKYSEELQKLYDEEGVKPSGGCLWSLLPLPFLMAIYGIIRRPLTYLMGMTSDNIESVYYLLYNETLSGKSANAELSMAQDVFLNYDKITSAIPELANMPRIDFSFLGLDLTEIPHFMFWNQENVGYAFGLWLIPVVSAVLSVITMIVTNKINAHILGTEKVVDQSQRTTMIIMPLFSLWICFTLPAALGIYWIGNSIVAILQELANIPFLKKHLVKLEAEKAKRKEENKERIKKEKQAQAEAKKKAAEEMRRIQMERKLNKSIATASREGMRAYARGRLYDPDRYPSFPYQDPNELILAKQARLEEEKAARKGRKKSAPAEEAPAPMETAAETVQDAVQTAAPAEAAEAAAEAVTEAAEAAEEAFVEESFLESETGDAEE